MSAAGPGDLAQRWRAAQDAWSAAIDLARPRAIPDPAGPLAYIDLRDRQTHINFDRLAGLGVLEHLPCVLAHEVGHHIRYPHTVSESRRMQRFLRETAAQLFEPSSVLVGRVQSPDTWDWLLNLFYDLLINDELADRFEDSFVAIFSALAAPDPVFAFYLAMFEELWGLAPGAMVPAEADAALAEIDRSWRVRARNAGEFIRSNPQNRPLQLARFLVALRPFVVATASRDDGVEVFERVPVGAEGELGIDGVADLLRRRSDEEEARRWLRSGGGDGGSPDDGDPEGTGGGVPGTGGTLDQALARLHGMADERAVAITVYRRSAERTPMELPRSIDPGDSIVPGPHRRWEVGDDLAGLDWIGSVLRAGGAPVPGQSTVARTFLPSEPRPGKTEAPWIEIYVDSSGSMPNPTRAHSHQVEAGFVLAHAAVKAGGRVRIVQYSAQKQCVAMDSFTRSTRPAYEALVGYIGGGTWFPWDELARSLKAWKRVARVRRVVLSDWDFISNFEGHEPAAGLCRTAAEAGGFTALLNVSAYYEERAKALREAGVEVVRVEDWSTVAEVARALSGALFGAEVA